MLSRLRTSLFLHRTVWVLALLLPLSLNAAAAGACDGHGDPGAAMPHADTSMPAHAGHDDMTGGHGDCGDPVCQTACGGTTAMAAPETTPVTPTRHAETGPAPATTPQAGYHELPLRPPLT